MQCMAEVELSFRTENTQSWLDRLIAYLLAVEAFMIYDVSAHDVMYVFLNIASIWYPHNIQTLFG